MKKVFYLLSIITLFSNCRSNNKQTATDSAKTSRPIDQTQQLIKKFKPFLPGVWVTIDYINDLDKTHSPFKSFVKLHGIPSFIIDADSIKADSLVAGASMNNHEGDQFVIYLKKGINPAALPLKMDYENRMHFYDLGYLINKNDTNLVIYRYDKNKKLINQIIYEKVIDKDMNGDMGYGIDYITNKKLISGKYIVTDSLGNTTNIEFTNDGKVAGFPGISTYYVNTDFEAGPANNIDQLSFDLYTKHQKDFAFKIYEDTLNVYRTTANADSTLLFFGKLVYKMVRKKQGGN